MGYFTAGYVFNASADWKRLDTLDKSVRVQVFKHKREPLWIMACNGSGNTEWPFAEFVGRYTGSTDPLRDVIVKAVGAVSSEHGTMARDGIALGSAIHQALGAKTYFFAADDEGLDLGCEIDAGAPRRFKFRNANGTVELADGRVSIAPITTVLTEADGREREFGPSDKKAIEALRALPNVDVHATKRIREDDAEPSQFFGTVVSLWPKGWPDPETTTGLGTWDPMQRVKEDFDRVYESPGRKGFSF